MKDTILFDLDGTLLPMDLDKFMKLYFGHLGEFFKDKVNPELMMKYVLKATETVITVNDGRSNEDKFMETFSEFTKDNYEYFRDGFLTFYQTAFSNVQASTYQSSEMRESVTLLKEKGYKVAIATNPLFPMVANVERIKWAGFEPEEFDYVSCFEDSFSTKPHTMYYQGVLDKINKQPENCYMIGNDIKDDLAAKKLGIETYIITNHLVNSHNLENNSDHTGTYQDFLEFVQNLPIIK